LSYAAPAPAAWFDIPADQRGRRTQLSSDQCEIDGRYFFVAGNLDIPITDRGEVFQWTVWVSLSRANYDRMTSLWTTDGRESERPYFGWLATLLPLYPDTLNLKTHVHTRPVGQRPFVELEPTDHPLALEQRDGIAWQQVQKIAALILHAPA
jgi:hypothetical protein